jgi:hypothetical protein
MFCTWRVKNRAVRASSGSPNMCLLPLFGSICNNSWSTVCTVPVYFTLIYFFFSFRFVATVHLVLSSHVIGLHPLMILRHAISRRPVIAEAKVSSQRHFISDFWSTDWHWVRFYSDYLSFPVRVFSHQFSILIFLTSTLYKFIKLERRKKNTSASDKRFCQLFKYTN